MPVSAHALLPYLDEGWHRLINAGWTQPYFFSYAYPHESGFARADAQPGDGSPAGSDFALLREQLLDRYDITVAILTALFFPSDSHVQYEFATALAAAYNDWVAESWLTKDARLRGSVCVNVNDPESAAAEIDRVAGRPGILQVMLPPLREGYGQKRYDPIFAAAARHVSSPGVNPDA